MNRRIVAANALRNIALHVATSDQVEDDDLIQLQKCIDEYDASKEPANG